MAVILELSQTICVTIFRQNGLNIAEIVEYQLSTTQPASARTDLKILDSQLNMLCRRRVFALIGSRAASGLFYIIYLQTAEVLFKAKN